MGKGREGLTWTASEKGQKSHDVFWVQRDTAQKYKSKARAFIINFNLATYDSCTTDRREWDRSILFWGTPAAHS